MALTTELDDIINPLIKGLIAKKGVAAKDLEAVLNITIQKVVHSIHALAITLFLLGKDDKIHFSNVYYSDVLYRGNADLEKAFMDKKAEMEKVVMEKDKGIVGKVLSTGKSYFCKDASNDPNFYAQIDTKTGFETKSMITVPLLVDGRAIGAIQVLNKYSEGEIIHFDDNDLFFLEEVANYSAKIIQKVNSPDIEFSETELASYVAQLTKRPFVELAKDFEPDTSLLGMISPESLRRYYILPIKKLDNNTLRVILGNPLEYQQIESFEIATRLRVKEIIVSTQSDIKRIIDAYLTSIGEGTGAEMGDVVAAVGEKYSPEVGAETVDLGEKVSEDSAPIIQLANQVIEDAFTKGASDIHIEPFEKEVIVRYRVDGVLQEVLKLPSKASRALTARYKIMSNLNIAEKRLPQDGRIKFKFFTKKNIDIEMRVSIAPLAWGEKICMRILDMSKGILPLDKMGFSPYNLDTYKELIKKPYGMVLHVGPTGSGKTSTLYGAISEINTPDINIQTAEDPVEFMLPGINQMQMKKEIGLTFASALRCFLRQDPDVILVGEIRDTETAEIAIEAALTGHLLFSTLHTNDAATTVTRFVEMGIEPFLVSATLLGVCAQRLVRRLCNECKKPQKISDDERRKMGLREGVEFFGPVGCERCNHMGYRGRMGVHELLTLNDEIKELINKKVAAEIIKKAAVKSGMIPLFDDGMAKAEAGITSLEEIFSTLRAE